ncbi:MAG TPA: YeeE/YedE family protein [Rudaea sp.]|jgi:hypothetical protein
MHPWLSALFGGVLIGLSATLLLLLNGRIAGISGIVNGLTQQSRSDEWAWRAAFIAGLMVAGGAAMHWLGQATPSPASVPVLIVAGLLVGFGTRLGGGCTSGHGICGLGRLSKRSLVAVCVFMAMAVGSVFVVRHVVGVSP